MSIDWVARQLASQPGGLNLTISRYNPRPPGIIRKGSATEAVLLALQSSPGMFLTFGQILARSKRTDKAVSWGLIYLRSQGRIEVSGDPRSDRYRRYRFIK